MKVLSTIKYLFSAVGFSFLIGAAFAYKNASDFLLDAVSTQGLVVDMAHVQGSDSVSYHPIVKFIGGDGQSVQFTSREGVRAASYPVGKRVEVLYSPSDVNNAKLKEAFSLWGMSIGLAIFGVPLLLIGAGIFLVGALKKRKNLYLQRNGSVLEAKIQSVGLNTSLNINGKNPFVIMCQWLNPVTAEIHVFESENIWFDPSPYIDREAITVFIKKDNPKKYYVDISFLPKLAR
ncbi:MAG: DUF3592 domain-containing protein [Pseudomonas sp.]